MSSGVALDSARQNLASSFVNSFVNAAFGADKLLTEDGNKWIYKNKEHGTTNENFYLSCNRNVLVLSYATSFGDNPCALDVLSTFFSTLGVIRE